VGSKNAWRIQKREIAERSLYEKIGISVDGKNKNCDNGKKKKTEQGQRGVSKKDGWSCLSMSISHAIKKGHKKVREVSCVRLPKTEGSADEVLGREGRNGE